MYNLEKGSLRIGKTELDNISELIKNGKTPLEALEIDLEKNNISIKKVHSLEMQLNEMNKEKYLELYSILVCEFWNK